MPARQQVDESRLDLVGSEPEERPDHLVLVGPLGQRLEELICRLGVAPCGALDHVRAVVVRGGGVVTEEVQLQLDRVGRLELIHERGERPRLRRLVDDPEQVGGDLHRAEHQLVDGAEEVLRYLLTPLLQPGRAEVEGVVVGDVTERADAHQHLGRLGHVDLDLDPGTGEVEHRSSRGSFDSHLTHVA